MTNILIIFYLVGGEWCTIKVVTDGHSQKERQLYPPPLLSPTSQVAEWTSPGAPWSLPQLLADQTVGAGRSPEQSPRVMGRKGKAQGG